MRTPRPISIRNRREFYWALMYGKENLPLYRKRVRKVIKAKRQGRAI